MRFDGNPAFLIAALGQVSFLPGTAAKRFVRQLQGVDPATLTERQLAYLQLLAWQFRRQLPADMVPLQKPADLPPKSMNKGLAS